jgi:predicted trehalose synthase
MQQSNRYKQTAPLDQRLQEEAKRLRKEAQGTPPGIERNNLIRRARQAETASQMNEWLTSPGLASPK